MVKNKIKSILIFSFLIVFTVVATGCDTWDNFYSTFISPEEQVETVKIGVLEPKSGDDVELGQQEIDGIELAREMHPQVLGKDVELVYEDTQSSVYTAETAIQGLLNQKPAAILGPYGEACALTASDYVYQAKTPAIAISNTNDLLIKNNPYYFRVKFMEAGQGAALARYAKNDLKAPSLAIFRQDGDDVSADITKAFINEATKVYKKNPVVAKPFFKMGETDFTKYLDIIKKSGAKVVFAPIKAEVADLFFQQVEQNGMTDITFLNGSTWAEPEFSQVLKKHPSIKVFVATTQKAENTQNKVAQDFLNAYHEKFGESKEPPENTALAYDAYMLAVESIEKAKSQDGEAVRTQLAATKNFQGASGILTFNPDGEPIKTLEINKIESNILVPVTTMLSQ